MSKMLDDSAINDSSDPSEAAAADRRLDVRFTVEKRLNHAANTRVSEHNTALEDRAVLLDHAHKFDEGKATRAEKLPEDPIYREIEFVSIRIPGDNTLTVHRPIMASDKIRFRPQYERFKQGRNESLEGTPIDQLPDTTHGTIKELAYIGVTTIEQAANIPDSLLKMMGGTSLKQRAAAWVAKNRKSTLVSQTNEALAERDALIAQLTARLDALEIAKPAKAATK
jgi:hypothetical protein